MIYPNTCNIMGYKKPDTYTKEYLYPADAYTGRDLSLFATINKQELLLLIKVI